MASLENWKIACVLLLTLVSCSSPIRILNQEADPNFTLSAYQTYSFHDEQTNGNASIPAEYGPYVDLLKKEIGKQLQARGLQEASQNPDMLVNIGLAVTTKTQTRETRFGQDGPYYTGQRRYTWRSEEVATGRYKEGSVSIDLVDRQKNELIWKADAVSVLPGDEDKIEERITEGVQKLFEGIK